MLDDDDLHPADCDCFPCAVLLEARKRVDAGLLDDWAVPGHLVDLLAEQIATRVNAAQCLNTVELYGHQLRVAVCRHHPQLGAKIIPLHDRSEPGQAVAPAEAAPGAAPADPEGRSLSPGPNPLRGIGRTPLSEGSALATLPEQPGGTNVTFLNARGASASGSQPAQIRKPPPITPPLPASPALPPLATLSADTLREMWWACQSWLDLPPPDSPLSKALRADGLARAIQTQLRLEDELRQRRELVPTPPTAAYLSAIRPPPERGDAC